MNGASATTRQRVVAWDDPAGLAERARDMAGLDFLRAMVDAELPAPPVAQLLGMRIVEVEWGVDTWNGNRSRANLIGPPPRAFRVTEVPHDPPFVL